MSSDVDKYKHLVADYLASRGIELTRAGPNRHALNCLFHEDGNASAYLRDGKIQCFGCNKSYDIFDCVERLEGIRDFKDQLRFLEQQYPNVGPVIRPETKRVSTDLPPRRILSEAEAREMYSLARVQELGDYAFKGRAGKLVKQWAYRTTDGRIEIVDARFEKDGKKTVVSVWTDGKTLRLRGAPLCLWGRDKIRPTLPLLVVEGAKCAAIASKALPRFCVTTWNQGSANAGRVNWSPVKNHPQIFIFPDSDAAGKKAADAIKNHLPNAVVVPQPIEAREKFPDKKSIDVEESLQVLGAERLTEYILNYEPPATTESAGNGGDEPPHITGSEGTDLFNAQLFAQKKNEMFCYVVEKRTWFYWTGKRWKGDDGPAYQAIADLMFNEYSQLAGLADAESKKHYFKMLKSCQSYSSIKNALTLAQTDPRMRRHADDFDSDPWLFNVSNGTICLKTGALKKHDPKNYITIIVDTEYKPSARSKLWDDFFSTVTDGDTEYANYIMRCVGYTMVGVVKEKCFFFPFGAPDTGKSVFFRAIASVFGGYSTSVDPSTWTTKRSANTGHADDVARLKGIRLVETDEFSLGSRFNEGLIKNITGGGEITASQKGEKTISFLPQCTIWLASNDRPHIRHEDDGMWNRLRVLPFDNVVPKDKQDRALPERLSELQSRQAILAACVEGCLDWQKKGIIELPQKVAMAYLEYFKRMDPLGGFIEECCERGEHYSIPRRDLFSAYKEYCDEENIQPKFRLGNKRFADLIQRRGVEEGPKTHGGNRYWQGISLKGRLY